MLKFYQRHWRTALSARIGLGIVLIANASCSHPEKRMVSHDPFNHTPPTVTAEHQMDEPTRGNHKMLENAGIPLGEKQNRPTQTAMTQSPTARPPQSHPSTPMQRGEAAFEGNDEGTVRVRSEWPALPEKTIGYKKPEGLADRDLPRESLPPGGYENRIGKQTAWTETESPKKQQEDTQPEAAASGQVVPTAFEEPIQQADRADKTRRAAAKDDADFTPNEPRLPLTNTSQSAEKPGETCPPFPVNRDELSCDPDAYPDEYICDGGDRKLPVHYGPGTREGLDTQDTIAEYQDDTGEQHVKATNEVCVYAPRFGAVKSSTGSSVNLSVDRALGAYESVNGHAFNTRIKPNTEESAEQINAATVRSRPSGLESEEGTRGIEQATTTEHHVKLENTNTDYNFTGQVAMEQSQAAFSTDRIQAAAGWTRKQSPVIVGADVSGSEAYSWFRPEVMVGLEDKKKIGDLYIDKAVDKTNATSGDVLTFTIRYRNTGERSLYHVQIIDNLTPRLEYIEGSATSDRDGQLVVEDNQEGSLILKWEIEEEIKGETGGVVSFKARVR